MKIINNIRNFTIFTIFFALTITALANPKEDFSDRNDNAIQVAKAWATSLTEGRTAVTASLSTLPFSLDGKEVKTFAELNAFYKDVIERKGKRSMTIVSAKVESSTKEQIIIIITLKFKESDEALKVLVKPSDIYRVVGFKD